MTRRHEISGPIPASSDEDERERHDERRERRRSDGDLRARDRLRDQREQRDPEDHEDHRDEDEVLKQEHRLARQQRVDLVLGAQAVAP